ncbi:MAG TPA: family 20 glycosylhydrolase, partial [Candidatus Baltobacteraceae bacterium]|nr:family 20 glycosylhydrolase [Candidatus Baltobacteraceae bacterium]
EGYALAISQGGIGIFFRETGGLRAATATLRQLLRQYGRHLPCLKIRDWPDFPRRGVMLDISRGRVPKLQTLLDLAEKLSDFKINELQLYIEHTFAYRKYKSVWQSWGALTAKEIQILDARCRELGVDLVPNQNSFGHLRYFLEHPKLKNLAEVSEPYEGGDAATGNHEFLRRPTTLAPNHLGTIPFLRGLYDELLPNFSSRFFNVGCDETWDLGRGQSKRLCEANGKGRVYLDFLKKIHAEVSSHDKCMMFWGDIILKYPKLISELAELGGADLLVSQDARQRVPTNIIALNWGYEANHPFEKEAAQFAKAGIPFYVCPGTSSWQTLIGKHDNALANLRAAAKGGKKFGAIGFLNTDWGDGGHPQPLTVSWPMFLAGASLAWNAKSFDESKLLPVLSRDVFKDSTGKIAGAAFKLGFAHKKLGVNTPNETPLGTVIAAPKPEDRELFCRNGLKWFSKIPAKKIRATLDEIEKQRAILRRVKPNSNSWKIPLRELDLAARMAAQSCKFMLWQQKVAAGNILEAKQLARTGIRELQKLEKDFKAFWPLRNKATTKHCTPFLRWRIAELSENAE